MKTSGTPKAVPASRRAWSRAGVQCLGRLDDPHAPAAAAHRRLDDHRVAERVGQGAGLGCRVDRRSLPGEHRDAGLPGQPPRGDLVAQQVEQLGTGADEDDPGPLAGPRELGVLRQEAVAGMDRVDALLLGQLDDRVDVEVAADRLARPAHLVGLVGLEPMRREAVLVRVDRHRPDAQLVCRAEDPDRDLAPVGGHQLAECGHRAILVVKERAGDRRAAGRQYLRS